jgi:hypothetical protein
MNQRYLHAPTAVAVVACLANCATAPVARAPGVPEALRLPPSQVLLLTAHASGVQIYECKASKGDPARFEWAFVAPEAELRDHAGKTIGRHYGGPTWEANDGSKIVGAVIARDAGPDPAAIPWLLLSATSTGGAGVISHTRTIQRLRTAGGKAPADGCTEAAAGKQTRVAYTADYLFYTAPP